MLGFSLTVLFLECPIHSISGVGSTIVLRFQDNLWHSPPPSIRGTLGILIPVAGICRG